MTRYLAAIVVTVCIFFAIPAAAQFETADVLGMVRDTSGSAIAHASVNLLNEGTGIQTKTQTDANGDFTFPNVKVGRYTVSAEAPGFAKAIASGIKVDVDARQRVDLTMQVGQVSQTVNVTGAAAVLETDSSEHGQVVNTQQIVELPLNGRNMRSLALLATNTYTSRRSAISFSASGTPREGAFNVNGMRSTYNNFLLDGMDNNAYSTQQPGLFDQVVQPSPDAVAEFKVITSNFSAEYGRVGGAVINAVLRSGTNDVSRNRLRISAQHRSERDRLHVFPDRLSEADYGKATSSAQPLAARSSRTSCSSLRIMKDNGNRRAI